MASRAWVPTGFTFGTIRFLEAYFGLFVYPQVFVHTQASFPLFVMYGLFFCTHSLPTGHLLKRVSRVLFNIFHRKCGKAEQNDENTDERWFRRTFLGEEDYFRLAVF